MSLNTYEKSSRTETLLFIYLFIYLFVCLFLPPQINYIIYMCLCDGLSSKDLGTQL